MMKTIKNNLVTIILILFTTTTVSAQQWCTNQFDADDFNIKSSPDYGKTYTVYFFDQTKPLRKDLYFTNIFKVSFKFYGSMPIPIQEHIFKDFNQYLKDNVDESIKTLYMGSQYNNSNRVNYCMSLEDLQARLAYEKEKARKRGREIKVLEQYIPSDMALKPFLRDDPIQNLSFDVIK